MYKLHLRVFNVFNIDSVLIPDFIQGGIIGIWVCSSDD